MGNEKLKVAVVGSGNWGKNLVRNFAVTNRCELKYVCDLLENTLKNQKKAAIYLLFLL